MILAIRTRRSCTWSTSSSIRGPGPAGNGRVGDARRSGSASPDMLPTVALSYVPRRECPATMLAYGYQALLAASALEELALAEEVFGELPVPAQIAPLDGRPIQRSARTTGSLVTVEEGTRRLVLGHRWRRSTETGCSDTCDGPSRSSASARR